MLQAGAGIQLPPNAARIMDGFGLTDALRDAGAVELDGYTVLDHRTGEVIVARPGRAWAIKMFEYPWLYVHNCCAHRYIG